MFTELDDNRRTLHNTYSTEVLALGMDCTQMHCWSHLQVSTVRAWYAGLHSIWQRLTPCELTNCGERNLRVVKCVADDPPPFAREAAAPVLF